MTEVLIILAIALAPALPIQFVSETNVAHARDRWIIALLAIGTVWLATRELWLVPMGLWYLARWPLHSEPVTLHKHLTVWAAIGATWILLRSVAASPWFALVPWAWLVVAGWQVWLLVQSRRRRKRGRGVGQLGSPVITALYLGLVLPFCPWWGWPVLALGLGLACSWLGFLAAGLGLVWLVPQTAVPAALLASGVALLWWWSPTVKGLRLLEWTSRGDTVDSWLGRLYAWPLIVKATWQDGTWLWGHGPATMEKALLRWSSRYGTELPYGEAFMELLQHLYEYGMLGVVAVIVFAAGVIPHLALGDPWSAAWAIGVLFSVAHWPMRHPGIGLTWLAISARLATA